MKKTLVLAFALLVTAGLAAAEAADATEAAPTLEAIFAAEAGGCELPDFTGMSDEEIAEAAIESGFDLADAVQAQPPACPVSFACNSITNCAAGPNCSVTDLGPCCSSGGLVLCCIQGTIKVQRCPCVCTAFVCSVQCAASTNVRWRCV